MKKNQKDTATRQRQDSVTVRDAITMKTNTQKNNNRTGHQQDRDNSLEDSHYMKYNLPFKLLTWYIF